jgi:hypothetical protein
MNWRANQRSEDKKADFEKFFEYMREFEKVLDLKATLRRIEEKQDKILRREQGDMNLKQERDTLNELKEVAQMEPKAPPT